MKVEMKMKMMMEMKIEIEMEMEMKIEIKLKRLTIIESKLLQNIIGAILTFSSVFDLIDDTVDEDLEVTKLKNQMLFKKKQFEKEQKLKKAALVELEKKGKGKGKAKGTTHLDFL
jgi:hypothetical protein